MAGGAFQQRFEIAQSTAVNDRRFDKACRAASFLQHPIGYFQTPVVERLLDMATKIYAAIPIDHVIDEYTAIPPRMPWIVDDSCYGNMGISLSGCIILSAIIRAGKPVDHSDERSGQHEILRSEF